MADLIARGMAAQALNPQTQARNLNLVVDVKRDFNASGSTLTATGSINAGSNILTLTSNPDFKVGQGISVRKAGQTCSLATPSAPTVTPMGTTGSTTYQYQIVALDGLGGYTAASPVTTITNGNATLSSTNYNAISWPAVPGAVGYAVYRGNTIVYIGPDTTFNDTGAGAVSWNANLPSSPPTSPGADDLVATILSISGPNNTILTLSNTASNTASGVSCTHDDTAAINNAIMAAYNGGGGTVFLPIGTYTVSQIRMKTRVTLMGDGWNSVLLAKGGIGVHTVVLDTVNEYETCISNLQINGNNQFQYYPFDLIHYVNSGGTILFSDSIHILDRLLLLNSPGNGLYTDPNCHEVRATRIYATGCNNYSFYIQGTDSHYVQCTSGAAGSHGWYCAGPNTRYISCKSFGSGRLTGASVNQGAGYYIAANRQQFIGCEAQDNAYHGFLLYQVSGCVLSGCLGDANAYAGYYFWQSTNNVIDGCMSLNRNGTGGGNGQRTGISFNNGSTGNFVRAVLLNNSTNTVGGATGNYLEINSEGAIVTVPYSSTYTPTPFSGATMKITLTGNMTINAPPTSAANQTDCYAGQRMKFIFIQDSTGGRTVTFGSGYKANWSPVTTPNATNVIEFIFDGTYWIQTSAVVGM
jgi:hypothetical protein